MFHVRSRRLGVLFAMSPLAIPLAALSWSPAPAPFHPHFPKTLSCKVSKDCTLTVAYQTVTFNADGARKMEPGKAWHLAGATFESSRDVVVGGCKVAAGKYALSARKTKDQGFELVLHEGQGFSTKIGLDAHVLAAEFVGDAPKREHLDIDVQPAGDKEHTRLYLEVHFDTLLARAVVEVPQ